MPTDCDDFAVSTMAQETEDQVNIYPNPVSSFLTVEAAGAQEVLVLDGLGRVMMREAFRDEVRLDFSGLGAGVYIIKIKEQFFKIIK